VIFRKIALFCFISLSGLCGIKSPFDPLGLLAYPPYKYEEAIVFTTADYAPTWGAPYIEAATLTDANVTWNRLSDLAKTNSKTPLITFFSTSNTTYWVTCSDWSKVTAFKTVQASNVKNLYASFSMSRLTPRLTSFQELLFQYGVGNAVFDVVPLPPSLFKLSYMWFGCSTRTLPFPEFTGVTNATHVSGMENTFYNCASVTSFPEVNHLTNVKGLVQTWFGCSGVKTNFPAVSNLLAVSTLNGTWSGCSGNTNEFPYVNSLTNVNTLASTWIGCSGIKTYFPAVSNLVKVNTLNRTWLSCNGNTNEFPYVNSLTNVTNLTATWYNCSAIKNGFPAISNLVKATTLYQTYRACIGNTNEFPYVNSLTNVSDLRETWYNCLGIKNGFPAVSNLTKVTSLEATWNACSGNTNEFPYVNSLTNVTSLYGTWGGCTGTKKNFPDIDNLKKVTTMWRAYRDANPLPDLVFPSVSTLTNLTAINEAWWGSQRTVDGFPSIQTLSNLTTIAGAWYFGLGYTNTVGKILGDCTQFSKLTTSANAFANCTNMTGYGMTFVNCTKSASYTVGTTSDKSSYRTFYNCSNLLDWASIPVEYK